MDTTRASLLVRIRDPRDAEAWRVFDEIYRPMLIRFACARGLHQADAEDVVQHCMTTVHEHIGGFDYNPQKGRFKSWLRTIINNRIRNFFRVRREYHGKTQELRQVADQELTPEELFEKLWMQEHLRHCLRQLRENVDQTTFKAFHDYVIDQKPAEEVCGELGITADNLYSIKWRMTRKVGVKLKQLLGEAEQADE